DRIFGRTHSLANLASVRGRLVLFSWRLHWQLSKRSDLSSAARTHPDGKFQLSLLRKSNSRSPQYSCRRMAAAEGPLLRFSPADISAISYRGSARGNNLPGARGR